MSETPQLSQIINDLVKDINNDLKKFNPLFKIAEKTPLEAGHLALIIATFFLIMSLTGLFENTFITIYAFVYPAYTTLQVFCFLTTVIRIAK